MGLTSRRPLPTIIESAGIRYDGETDYIELLHPTTGEWIQWQKSNVMVDASVIVVNTDNLNGEVVTCSIGNESYTSYFTGGSVTFIVLTEGTVTLTCGTITQEINVTVGQTYNVTMNKPSARINFTTSNLNGEVITVVIDGKSYTSIFVDNVAVIDVYNFGTASIVCEEVSTSLEVAENGIYTVDLTAYEEIEIIKAGVNKTSATLISGWDYESGALTFESSEYIMKGIFKGSTFTITEEMLGRTIYVQTNSTCSTISFRDSSGNIVSHDIPEKDGNYYIAKLEIPSDLTLGAYNFYVSINATKVYIYNIFIK